MVRVYRPVMTRKHDSKSLAFAEDGDVFSARVGRNGQDAVGIKRVVCFSDGERVHLKNYALFS
jgi:hypothetical protein